MTENKEVKKEKNVNSPFGVLANWIKERSDVRVYLNDTKKVNSVKCKLLWYDNYNITATIDDKKILFFKSSIVKIEEI